MRAWRWVMFGLLLPTVVWAHEGRTNAQGCHNDRKHGGYHCHGGAVATPSVPLRRQRQVAPPASPPAEVSPRSSEPKDTGGLPCKSDFPNSMTITEKIKELDQCYSDALLRPEEYQRRRAELLEQQANPPSSNPQPARAMSITEQLQTLKRQRENGEISPEAYYEKRSEMLKEDQ